MSLIKILPKLIKAVYSISPIKKGFASFSTLAWKEIYAGLDKDFLVHEPISEHRFQMELNLRDRVQFLLYIASYYEKETTQLIKKIIGKNFCFVDIGASIGYFSLLTASIEPTAKIYAFEPDQKSVHQFTNSILLNDFINIHLEHLAIGERDGKATLISSDPVKESGWNFIVEKPDHRHNYLQEVKINRLDNVLQKLGAPLPTLIKIDVEGYEMEVLKGALDTLETPGRRHIVIEINEHALKSQKTSAEKINSFLNRLGYNGYEIGKDGKVSPTSQIAIRKRETNYYYLKEK